MSETHAHDEHHAPVPVGIPRFASKDEMYRDALQQIESLLADDDVSTSSRNQSVTAQQQQQQQVSNDWRLFSRLTTALANISSVLFYSMNAQHTGERDGLLHSLPINWSGFYLLDRRDRLALASFQGKVACQYIKLGKGMCGLAALTNKDLAIEDVHSDPRHIACDAASQSEAVIVLREPSGKAVGVLDIDSAVKGRFTQADIAPLRLICDTITRLRGEELSALYAAVTNASASSSIAASVNSPSAVGMNATATSVASSAITQQRQTVRPGAANANSSASPIVSRPTNVVSRAANNSRQEMSDLKCHKNWELRYRAVNEMLNSSALSSLEERLQVKLLPEIVFDMNEIHFVMNDGSAGVKSALKFRACAQSSLANVVKYASTPEYERVRASLFPKENAAWAAKRNEFATFDAKVDWAFRNNYRGVWADANGNELEPVCVEYADVNSSSANDAVSSDTTGATAAPTASPTTTTTSNNTAADVIAASSRNDPSNFIDYDMLRQTDLPILFFASIDLWEDDLHDSGISKLVAKARVMEPCFFVLVRHILRVDGVRLQIRDTRHFHKFGTRKIVIEESVKALNIPQFLEENTHVNPEEFHRMLVTSQPEQLDMLKEEWKQNRVLMF